MRNLSVILLGCGTLGAHLLDAGLDSGAVLLQRSLPIKHDDTGADLRICCARPAQHMAEEVLSENPAIIQRHNPETV